MDGASYAPPRSALEEAHAAALAERGAVQRQHLTRHHALEVRHDYEEGVRRAEADQLRQRLNRIETRRDASEPLMRDAVIGGLAVATPLLLAASNASQNPKVKPVAMGVALLVGALAGREWMQHEHERRIDRLEDQAERIQGRLAVRSIPLPSPFPPLDLR